jgi:hypothetical protein
MSGGNLDWWPKNPRRRPPSSRRQNSGCAVLGFLMFMVGVAIFLTVAGAYGMRGR